MSDWSFSTCQPGDAIQVIAGQYENHMGIFVGVLGSYIQVRVRKVIGLHPLGDKTDNGLYDLHRLLPGQLQIDRINDCARLEDAVRGMNFGDVQDLPALTLGVSNEVREAFAYLHRLQDQFALARHDPRLVKYTMDLATIIAADLHLMHRGPLSSPSSEGLLKPPTRLRKMNKIRPTTKRDHTFLIL
eukprot:scaffold255799_cov28-Attheya_sp.AAC.2